MFFRRKYRYNLLKNVRVEMSTMKVERKYAEISSKGKFRIYWDVVDYKTTHRLTTPRVCPHEALSGLLRTAF